MDRKESVIKMGKERKLLSKLIALKRKKGGYKIQITWERVLLIIVLITLFPELHDQMYLARSRSTRLEIFLNSEGMSYQLGEVISKEELQQLAKGSKVLNCIDETGRWASEALIWRGTAFWASYTGKRDPQNVYTISVKRLSNVFPSLPRVVEVEFLYDKFKVYEISPGMSRKEAGRCLEKYGYQEWEGEYWKDMVSISLTMGSESHGGGVGSIRIRWYSSKEYREMLKAYKRNIKMKEMEGEKV